VASPSRVLAVPNVTAHITGLTAVQQQCAQTAPTKVPPGEWLLCNVIKILLNTAVVIITQCKNFCLNLYIINIY